MRVNVRAAVAVMSAVAVVGALALVASMSSATGTIIDPVRTLTPDVANPNDVQFAGGAFADGNLYIADIQSQPGGEILTIDPVTESFVSVSTPVDLFLRGGLDVDDGTFLVSGGTDEITTITGFNTPRHDTDFQRLDMTTGALIESFHTPFFHAGDIAVIDGYLYTVGFPCTGIVRVDLSTPGESTTADCVAVPGLEQQQKLSVEKAGTNLLLKTSGSSGCQFSGSPPPSLATSGQCVRVYTLASDLEVLSYAELNLEVPNGNASAFACGNGELFAATHGQQPWGTSFTIATEIKVFPFPICGAPNTATGPGVTVSPEDPVFPGTTPASITFDDVVTEGTTTVTTVAEPPEALPSGFELNGSFFEIATTATFTGTVTICLTYDPVTLPSPQLWHYDDVLGWVDITTSVSPALSKVCGETTSFSVFAVVREQAQIEARPIATNSRSANPNNNIALTVANSVASGETLTVSVATGTFNGAVGCSDTRGNSYTVVADRNTGNGRVFVCSTAVGASGLSSGDVVTATYPGFSGTSVASANAISGIATSTPVDAVKTNSGSNPAISSGNLTTTNAQDVLFAAISHTGTSTFVPGAGYTVIGAASGGSGSGKRTISPMFRVVTATGTFAATGNLSGSGFWQIALVAYRAP
jgi:hypothetical protein